MRDSVAASKNDNQADTIVALNPAACVSALGNRTVKDSELEDDLLPSIRSDGQLVAGIVSRHPTLSGTWIVAAGHRRHRCCEILDIPFRATVIDRVLSRAELIRIRVKENVLRKNPKPFELCAEVCDYKAEQGLETWTQVGEELSLHPATMSRITSVRHIPAELKAKAETVCPSVCWLIASSLKKNTDAMRRGFEFAATPGPDGKPPSRDAVSRFLESLKHGKPTAGLPMQKILKGSIDGRLMQIGIKPDDTTDGVIKWLNGVAGKLGKYRDVPPDTLGFLFSK